LGAGYKYYGFDFYVGAGTTPSAAQPYYHDAHLNYQYFGECRYATKTSFTSMTAMDKYGVNIGVEDCGVSIQYRPCLDLLNDELVYDSNGQVTQLYDDECDTDEVTYENLVMIGL
jgi:hypothetical protein